MNEVWVTIEARNVRSAWRCISDECENKHLIYVTPDFYEENGTPICTECGDDCTYLGTEVRTCQLA